MARYRRWEVMLVILAASTACAKTTTTAQQVASPTASPTNVPTVRTVNNARFGVILADAKGRTLYHFDKDTNGKVACTDACAATWPPLLLTKAAPKPTGPAGLGAVRRPDGASQITYNAKPLYRYSADRKPGDANGDGVGGVWHIAKPATATQSTPVPSTAAPAANAPTQTNPTRTSAPATPKPQATPYGNDETPPPPGPPNVPGPPGPGY